MDALHHLKCSLDFSVVLKNEMAFISGLLFASFMAFFLIGSFRQVVIACKCFRCGFCSRMEGAIRSLMGSNIDA